MPKPTEIRVYDPSTRRSWYLDTANPSAEHMTLEQIGHGLRSLQRFGGYTTGPLPVDEHCVRVGRFAEAIVASDDLCSALLGTSKPRPNMAAVRLAGLLHDAPEAITGYGDVLRPAKTPEVSAAEDRAMEAILDLVVSSPTFGPSRGTSVSIGAGRLDPGRADQETQDRIRKMLTECACVVHTADDLALYYEALLWSPGAEGWVARVPERHFPSHMIPSLNATMLPLVDVQGAEWATEVHVAVNELSRNL